MTTGCMNLARAGRVGRWGEQACYEHLQRAAAGEDSGIIIEWLNEEEEQGLPYVRCARIDPCHHLLTLTVCHQSACSPRKPECCCFSLKG